MQSRKLHIGFIVVRKVNPDNGNSQLAFMTKTTYALKHDSGMYYRV